MPRSIKLFAAAAVAVAGAHASALVAASLALPPGAMPRIATVDERYQSYNVEMAEVIGGKFWKPYSQIKTTPKAKSAPGASKSSAAAFQIGQDPDLFEVRPPIDLSNARLRKLATALGPAYVRVSGTWANTVYFQKSPQGPSAETRPQADNAKQQQHQNQEQGHNANDANSHQSQPGDAPAGFNGVLTRKEWK